MAIEVTVRDTQTGETQTRTITDDVIVICAGRHYVAAWNDYPGTGTKQITVKIDTGVEL